MDQSSLRNQNVRVKVKVKRFYLRREDEVLTVGGLKSQLCSRVNNDDGKVT